MHTAVQPLERTRSCLSDSRGMYKAVLTNQRRQTHGPNNEVQSNLATINHDLNSQNPRKNQALNCQRNRYPDCGGVKHQTIGSPPVQVERLNPSLESVNIWVSTVGIGFLGMCLITMVLLGNPTSFGTYSGV